MPVICSNIGGLGEVIVNGETGLHFKVGDVDDLVLKIYDLVSDRNLNFRLSVEARKMYEKKYTPEINLVKQLEIYKSVMV